MTGELPDWVKVGNRCPLVGSSSIYGPVIHGYAVIEKINKRYIVAGGKNYSLPHGPDDDRLRRTGDARWHSPDLYDPASERAAKAQESTRRARVSNNIRSHAEEITEATRNREVDVNAVRAAVAAIEALLAEVET